MATQPAPERTRLERVSANGVYRGRLKVRVIAPGVCGDQIDAPAPRPTAPRPLRNRGTLCANLGCANRRMPGASICATHAARRKGVSLCTRCGEPGHNARTCRDPR